MITKEKALDILDRMDFFQGQRAGRELWNEKSRYVQEMDLQIFREDVAELKAYIADVVPKSEVERLSHKCDDCAGCTQWKCDCANIELEVAREIFEEIEEVFRQHTEGGYYLNGAWFPERLDLYTGDAIAELKKKYTENENG